MAIIAFFTIMSMSSFAQEKTGKEPMQESFFPPELVMQHQVEIQLKKEQKELIINGTFKMK
jgi:hypothetical protein